MLCNMVHDACVRAMQHGAVFMTGMCAHAGRFDECDVLDEEVLGSVVSVYI